MNMYAKRALEIGCWRDFLSLRGGFCGKASWLITKSVPPSERTLPLPL